MDYWRGNKVGLVRMVTMFVCTFIYRTPIVHKRYMFSIINKKRRYATLLLATYPFVQNI